jgi:hypothetical protein
MLSCPQPKRERWIPGHDQRKPPLPAHTRHIRRESWIHAVARPQDDAAQSFRQARQHGARIRQPVLIREHP